MAGEDGLVASDFRTNLVELRGKEETADFTIVCGDKAYEVHELILSLHSTSFDRLFKSRFFVSRATSLCTRDC